jgi:hypothetical protein
MDTVLLRSYLDRMRRSPFLTLEDVRVYVGMTPTPPPPLPHKITPPSSFLSGDLLDSTSSVSKMPTSPSPSSSAGSHPGFLRAIQPCGPLVADTCPFLTEVTHPVGQTQAGAPLHLQSDSSRNPGANGAFAVICLDTSDARLDLWLIKDLPLGDGSVVLRFATRPLGTQELILTTSAYTSLSFWLAFGWRSGVPPQRSVLTWMPLMSFEHYIRSGEASPISVGRACPTAFCGSGFWLLQPTGIGRTSPSPSPNVRHTGGTGRRRPASPRAMPVQTRPRSLRRFREPGHRPPSGGLAELESFFGEGALCNTQWMGVPG